MATKTVPPPPQLINQGGYELCFFVGVTIIITMLPDSSTNGCRTFPISSLPCSRASHGLVFLVFVLALHATNVNEPMISPLNHQEPSISPSRRAITSTQQPLSTTMNQWYTTMNYHSLSAFTKLFGCKITTCTDVLPSNLAASLEHRRFAGTHSRLAPVVACCGWTSPKPTTQVSCGPRYAVVNL